MKANIHEGNLQKIDKILEMIINKASGVAVVPCVVALVVWAFVFVAYVFLRQVFGVVWVFVEEFTGYWVVFLCYFSLAYALKSGAHIKSDIVTRRLPKRVNSILELVTGFLAMPLVGYLMWRSIGWFTYGLEHTARAVSSLHTLLWPIYLFVTIGLGIFALVLLLKFVRNVITLARGKEIEPQIIVE